MQGTATQMQTKWPRVWAISVIFFLVQAAENASKTAAVNSEHHSPPLHVDDGLEPPINPFLADSPWPMTHRNPYCQASSPWAGPSQYDDDIQVDFRFTAPVSSTLVYSNPDSNGNRIMWENNPFHTGKISSGMNNSRLDVIHKVSDGFTLDALSGGYYLLDKDGVFFAARESKLRSFTDAESGNLYSKIVKLAEFKLPEWALASSKDSVLGMNLMYDGYLVFTTAQGMVGVIRRDFTDLHVLLLGEGKEEISNMMAVDEDGGIYVVTSKHMYRVQWNGSSLSIAWTAEYQGGPDHQVGGRLGAGSGTTPTLMGNGGDTNDQDKLVVITDGAPLMNIVVFWRDKIPDDWEPIAPGKDRRIAAEVPITFGDPGAKTSVTEQSVLVRGYGAMVVNNDYGFRIPSWTPDVINQGLVTLTNLPWYAPYGAEKFEWNSTTRTLDSVWVNRNVSCPNGVPAMSVATNLAYCVGQRKMKWNIEAMDWDTGESVFYKETGYRLRYNSGYATLGIGPNREIVSGTLGGVLRVRANKSPTSTTSVSPKASDDEL